MLVVPQEQALKRWDTLPDNIREALASEHSVEILERITESEHIPGEKIPIISQVAGYVLMGFLHPEEAAYELQDGLKIDAKIAESISKSLNSRLFAPFKSQLEKIYAPAFETEKSKVREAPTPPPPKPIEGLKPPTLPTKFKTVTEKPAPLPLKTTLGPAPSPSQAPKPAPKMLDELGRPDLSGMAASRMAVKEVAPPKPVTSPPIASTRPSAPPISPQSPKEMALGGVKPSESESFGVVEEIKKLEHSGAELVDVLKKKPVVPPSAILTKSPQMPTMPSKPPEIKTPTGGPVMIHKESETEPIRSATSFKIEAPSQKFESPFLKPEEAPRTARVEMGGLPKWQPGAPAKTEVIKPPKVIHYSALQTPVERPPMPPTAAPIAPRIPQAPPITTPPMLPSKEPFMPADGAPMVAPQSMPTAPKVATVSYGLETREEPAKKASGLGWFRSIFSKKSKLREKEIDFIMPSSPAPKPVRQAQDKPSVTSPPQIQKAADIRSTSLSSPSGNLGQKEEVINLESLTKVEKDIKN